MKSDTDIDIAPTLDIEALKKVIESHTDQSWRIYAAAMEYGRQGFAILPAMREGTKFSTGKTSTGKEIDHRLKYTHATSQPSTIEKWWHPDKGKWAGHNICLVQGQAAAPVATGAIDIDAHHGGSQVDLEQKYGKLDGPRQKTPNGGVHILVAHSKGFRCSVSTIADGVDTRGGNTETGAAASHIIAAPSVVAAGSYRWWKGGTIKESPKALMVALARGSENIFDEDLNFVLPDFIPEGTVNDTLYRYGLSLYNKHGSMDVVETEMHSAWKEKCEVHENETEFAAIVKNVANSNVRKSVDRRRSQWGGLNLTVMSERSVRAGLPGPSESNLSTIMGSQDCDTKWSLAYDTFFQAPTTNNDKFKDTNYTDIAIWVEQKYSTEFGINKIVRHTDRAFHRRHTNAFNEWLNALPPWDEKDHITSLTKCLLRDPDPLHILFLRKMLLSCVARSYRPGIMVRNMVILIGTQERGKSMFFRTLCPDGWFTDSVSFSKVASEHGVRELIKQSSGKVLCEVAEMKGMRKDNPDEIKHFLSGTEANLVDKYEKHAREMPRVGVFVGTANSDALFRDKTGNTRFWPIVCDDTDINIKRVLAIRDQCWAQAFALHKEGEPHWIEDTKIRKDLAKIVAMHDALSDSEKWILEHATEGTGPFSSDPLIPHDLSAQPPCVPFMTKDTLRASWVELMPRSGHLSDNVMDYAMQKAGWTPTVEGIQRTRWKTKVSKEDDGAIIFGKKRERGQTIYVPRGWVAPYLMEQWKRLKRSEMVKELSKAMTVVL